MSGLSFNDRVVLVTGAGGGLGKTYCLLFASRGAKVVVNDFSKENADKVVQQIKAAGKGDAVANYDSVTNGQAIIDQTIQAFGRIDVVINNAGIASVFCFPIDAHLIKKQLRDKSFKAMTDKEFNDVQDVHVKGAYSVTHAAWPHFRKQKYGRIINTASAAGIYGSFGQANYSTAKFALVTFAKTLAREGVKYNIHANAIAPIAASPMTATIMPPDVLENLKPEHVAPVVAWLCHESCKETGGLFETGAGWTGQVRWELTKGAIFRTDETYTPSAVAARWKEISDFTDASHPTNQQDNNLLAKVEASKNAPPNPQGDKSIDFKDKVVLVTGGGAGIGRCYSLMYAKLGAKVCVNDFVEKNAKAVVEEIKQQGGQAAPIVASVEDGQKVIQLCVEAFGTVHVVVNNAGILRDKSFTAMTEKLWDDVYNIHVKGSYQVAHAAWPIFVKQKYGRILNTSSIVGVHGNFGQANYSTAKAGLIALTKTLALEGKKYNIKANCLVPTAGTAMTATVWTKEMLETFKPEFVAPVVGFLTSEGCPESGILVEGSGPWVGKYRWIRSGGVALSNKKFATPETIRDNWTRICKFDARATHPSTTQEAMGDMLGNFGNDADDSNDDDPEDSDLVRRAKKTPIESVEYSWTEKDVILYNLGIGASEKELKYTFEGSSDFTVIPTFGVIPQFSAAMGVSFDWLPNYSPMMLLHGEQYLELKKPLPTTGTVINKPRLLEVLDKGKAAAVTTRTETLDKDTGEVLAVNEGTLFIRGSGGFGGKKSASDRGAATAVNKPPSRKPDAVVEFKTEERQAAVYRLSGDANPLHIDPDFAKVGGFPKPILHGLCFFGVAGKAIFDTYGAYNSIKVRFAGFLFPGETVVTELWKEGNKVIFVARCKERNTVILSNAAATLV